jgi:prevent-host-death family protein
MNLISSTYARNNLSRLLDEVVKKGATFILLRKSLPQAVIIPYEDLEEREKAWQWEFQRLMLKSRPYFKNWLKKQKVKKVTEESLYELLNKAAGRS